ncbi:putative mitochondrial carrier [Smittium culicis]|uniref:Putative mitochondrial carrier n=1 Tax=Smittium culicis TaxID=133412 RepID=A0A1R1XNC1_9FUNG|nr:putative mitochondrial carrier [Smittium culicis]
MSATSAAVSGVVTGYPFDSIKTRMQAYHYSSIIRCTKITLREEGFFGLYRAPAPKDLNYILYSTFLSGGVSGSFVAVATCPLEFVKIHMQLSCLIHKEQLEKIARLKTEISKKNAYDIPKSSPNSISSLKKRIAAAENSCGINNNAEFKSSNINSAKNIIQNRGLLGLYTGLNIHVGKNYFFFLLLFFFFLYQFLNCYPLYFFDPITIAFLSFRTGIYFSTYEATKEIFRKLSKSENTGPIAHSLAGGCCGIFAWLIIFPIDLVKSVYQKDLLTDPTSSRNYLQCFNQIKNTYGIKGFYRGIGVTLFRAFPLHALNFTVYEYMREKISHYYKN